MRTSLALISLLVLTACSSLPSIGGGQQDVPPPANEDAGAKNDAGKDGDKEKEGDKEKDKEKEKDKDVKEEEQPASPDAPSSEDAAPAPGVKKGGKRTDAPPAEAPAADALPVSASDEQVVAAQAVYASYDASVLTSGQRSLLFFHASWCPYCKEADAELQRIYEEQAAVISTYKVDFDTETDLRDRFGVSTQHTVVLIDEQGEILDFIQGPTAEQLRAAVAS